MSDLIKTMIQAMEEKKASDILCLNLKGASDFCDFKLVCSCDSDRQSRAIAEEIEAMCSQQYKLKPAAVEGKSSGFWILMDYGSVVVHIFQKEYRSYYALEKLWPNRAVDMKS